MAPPKKMHLEDNTILTALMETATQLSKEVIILKDQFKTLEREVFKPKPSFRSINKLEEFNGETAPEVTKDNMRMTDEDKLISINNACKILPPNLIVNGRHIKENATAICGFMVSEEQLDEVYKDFSHNE